MGVGGGAQRRRGGRRVSRWLGTCRTRRESFGPSFFFFQAADCTVWMTVTLVRSPSAAFPFLTSIHTPTRGPGSHGAPG